MEVCDRALYRLHTLTHLPEFRHRSQCQGHSPPAPPARNPPPPPRPRRGGGAQRNGLCTNDQTIQEYLYGSLQNLIQRVRFCPVLRLRELLLFTELYKAPLTAPPPQKRQ
jgi:hypothetical protein